jgi:hypothetical protein
VQPVHYFCFPEVGIAVAVHPGDMLLFNLLFYHCCARKTSHYRKNNVFANAFYLKTEVVGLHDNNIDLTEAQEKFKVEHNMA